MEGQILWSRRCFSFFPHLEWKGKESNTGRSNYTIGESISCICFQTVYLRFISVIVRQECELFSAFPLIIDDFLSLLRIVFPQIRKIYSSLIFKYQSQSRIVQTSLLYFQEGEEEGEKKICRNDFHIVEIISYFHVIEILPLFDVSPFPPLFDLFFAIESSSVEEHEKEKERERDLAGRCIQIWIVDVATSRRRIEKWGRAASIFEHRIFYTFALSLFLSLLHRGKEKEREKEERT